MDKFGRIIIKQLNDHIYLLDDTGESTGYLVVGQDKALVIDTMNGVEDVAALVKTITDLPIMVVNTHGHCDHIFGNIYFDKAYINKADLEIAKEHAKFPEFVKICQEKKLSMPEFEFIDDGQVIDLGGLTLDVYGLAGHTPGGIMLLLKEDRVLFTGDSINHHLWMQLPESLPMDEFVVRLEKLMFLCDQADYILYGHATDFDSIDLMKQLLKGAKEIAAGKTENDQPYNWFGGVGKQHEFAENSVICYK